MSTILAGARRDASAVTPVSRMDHGGPKYPPWG
jgi:hypothetical protein